MSSERNDPTDQQVCVMLVDDVWLQLEVMAKRLRQAGFIVETFEDPDDAIKFLEKSGRVVNIIVSDLSMGTERLERGVRFLERASKIDLSASVLAPVGAWQHNWGFRPAPHPFSNGNGTSEHHLTHVPILIMSNFAEYVRDPSKYEEGGDVYQVKGEVRSKLSRGYKDEQVKDWAARLRHLGIEEADILTKQEVERDINILVQAIGRKLKPRK